jgi:putative hydrolases of HD superfamily
MSNQQSSFGALFKKFRLKSGFATIREFGDALSEKGFPFEDSLFSHWQKNSRIPKDRKLLLAIINIFIEHGGVSSAKDINMFLESVNQGYITEQESISLTKHDSNLTIKLGSAKNVLRFLLSTCQSKRIVRSGWLRVKVKDPESVADHSFQLSIMAMVLSNKFGAVDKEKLFKMAILHNLGETVTGDVIWMRGNFMDLKKRTDKEKVELDGIIKIFNIIGLSEEYKRIFDEMRERKSLEARIFWQLDKLEMAIQALAYEKEFSISLSEFFLSSDFQIHYPFLRKIFKQILKNRPKIKNNANK